MIAGLKPYPVYKDSGVPWLGDIPSHWQTPRLKTVFREIDHRSGTGEEPLLSLRMQRGLVDHHRMGGKVIPPSSLVKFKRTQPGEIVMNRMRAAAGLFAATATVGLVSPDYAVLRPRVPVDLRYFVYLFRTPPMMSIFRVESRGLGTGESGFLRLYTERFGMLAAPAPPLDQQFAIVRFLDHIDRRIRRYTRAKQKLIKLLEEQKQAIIHRAVTCGIDSNFRLKQLGSAPSFQVNASWRVVRLWQISRIRSEKNSPDLDLLSVFLGRGVIPYGQGGGQVHKPSLDLAGYQVVYPGDLVLNNQQAWRGSVGVSKYRGIISPAYVVISLADSLDSRFADYLFQSRAMVSQFVTSSKGVGDIQRDIHTPWLKNTRVPIPPLAEQQAISAYLDQELADIARQLSFLDRENSLFHEYRTRLIADVVTGKLDVREAAAQLPDEVEDLEPLDDAEPLGEDEGGDDAELDPVPGEADV